jgi:tetratricopeptide (TPR) repeat protein
MIAAVERLAAANPKGLSDQDSLASLYADFAEFLSRQPARTAEADQHLRRSLELYEQLSTDTATMAGPDRLGYTLRSRAFVLWRLGRLDDAAASFRLAITKFATPTPASDPGQLTRAFWRAETQSVLGALLLQMGKPAEAEAEYRKALEFAPTHVGATNGLARAQRLSAVQDKLPALLKGDYKPTTNGERLALAELCTNKKRYRASAGLYADAFAAGPKLADDLKTFHRYNAACVASLSAASLGEDAAKLDDKERARLRKQALDRLRADLALWAKQLERCQPADRAGVRQQMKHWQQDSDLAGIRDAAALAKLPADEQKAFTQLWADVADLLKRTEEGVSVQPSAWQSGRLTASSRNGLERGTNG